MKVLKSESIAIFPESEQKTGYNFPVSAQNCPRVCRNDEERRGTNTEVIITTRDRLLRAWENSMELVRDFEAYAKETRSEEEVSRVFSELADEECEHASKLRELLCEQQTQIERNMML